MPTQLIVNTIAELSLYDNSTAEVILVLDTARTGGNPFQWTNSATVNNGTVYAGLTGFWEMMFSGPASVAWFGATGDGLTNDSAAIQNALDNFNSIYFPAGHFRCNVQLSTQQVFGEKESTIISSFSPDDAAFHLGWRVPNWDYVSINNVIFDGNDKQDVGVIFDYVSQGSNDVAGRWVFNHVSFQHCSKAVYKPYGNIGNTFNSCNFLDSDYHYFALADKRTLMHAGCDTFNSCHFESAGKAAVYINNDIGFTGQTTFNQCVFEANGGFGIFTEHYGNQAIPPLVINDCWYEANGLSPKVEIEGVTYTPGNNYLKGTIPAVFTNSISGGTQLVNSEIVLDESDASGEFLLNENSFVQAKGGTLAGIENHLGILYQTAPNIVFQYGLYGTFIRMNARQRISHKWSGNVLTAETFNGADSWGFSGTALRTAHRVKDGTSSGSCAQLTIDAGYNLVHLDTLFTLSDALQKYLVWIIDLKRISGEAPIVGIQNIATYALPVPYNVRMNEWWTVCGYRQITTDDYASTGLLLGNPSTSDIVVRIGGISFLLFDKKEDAIAALNAGELYVKPALPVTVYGNQSPALAAVPATWSMGDRCINNQPLVGQPKSWVCTLGGTPGGWVSEGNL
jgi:hypothetical protein